MSFKYRWHRHPWVQTRECKNARARYAVCVGIELGSWCHLVSFVQLSAQSSVGLFDEVEMRDGNVANFIRVDVVKKRRLGGAPQL
jgi:hypothetical protein